MKINEFTNPLKTFIVSVRVVLKDSSFNATTSITAQNSSQAFHLLSRLYGQGNVMSISELVNESDRICQIQQDQADFTELIHSQHDQSKDDSDESCSISERGLKRPTRKVPAVAIPDQIKHQKIQNELTKKFLRQTNMVKPTANDIRIARNRADTAVKRADLDYQRQVERSVSR